MKSTKKNYKIMIVQFGKYIFFGIISTVLYLFVGFVDIYFFKLSVLPANTIAFCVAFIFSYFFQTMFVFTMKINIKRFFRFFLIQYGSFIFSYLISTIILIQNPYLQTILISCIIPLFNFFAHKFWTFKNSFPEY